MHIKKIRKQILDSFLENLAGISDKEYQKRVWIEGKGPECDDFDETVCDFFDLGEPIFDNYKGYGITDSQYLLLIKFRKELDAFLSGPNQIHYLPREFIDIPEWKKIMEMAKEVLKAFHYEKKTR